MLQQMSLTCRWLRSNVACRNGSVRCSIALIVSGLTLHPSVQATKGCPTLLLPVRARPWILPRRAAVAPIPRGLPLPRHLSDLRRQLHKSPAQFLRIPTSLCIVALSKETNPGNDTSKRHHAHYMYASVLFWVLHVGNMLQFIVSMEEPCADS